MADSLTNADGAGHIEGTVQIEADFQALADCLAHPLEAAGAHF